MKDKCNGCEKIKNVRKYNLYNQYGAHGSCGFSDIKYCIDCKNKYFKHFDKNKNNITYK